MYVHAPSFAHTLTSTFELALTLSHRRDKKKKSCQDLGLFKLTSVKKKSLQASNKKLRAQLKHKGVAKAVLRREVKDAKADSAYWEDQHARMQEGDNMNMFPCMQVHQFLCTHARTYAYTHITIAHTTNNMSSHAHRLKDPASASGAVDG